MGQHRCTDSVAEKGAKRMNTLFNQPLKVVNAGEAAHEKRESVSR